MSETMTRRDKQLMAAGIRWHLAPPEGMSAAPQCLTAAFGPGDVETRRDALLPDPEFAEAYEAAGSVETWRAFAAREGL